MEKVQTIGMQLGVIQEDSCRMKRRMTWSVLLQVTKVDKGELYRVLCLIENMSAQC